MSTAAGVWDYSKQWSSEELEQIGQHMMEQMARYPKDHSGMWQQHRVWLGCHDQWVTTEAVGQQMPYYDSLRELAITGDVILDNREELLEQLGLRQQPEIAGCVAAHSRLHQMGRADAGALKWRFCLYDLGWQTGAAFWGTRLVRESHIILCQYAISVLFCQYDGGIAAYRQNQS